MAVGRIVLVVGLLATPAALAQDGPSLRGKTVTLIIGSAPGGGTDAFGRLAATGLAAVLPGAPAVVVRNIPGADGITAMNYMVQQVAPDGMTITAAANTTADPLHTRKPQAQFDPAAFGIFGGAGRGGEVLLINRAAEQRLADPGAPPVVMGALGGALRSGMQMTAWGIAYLGWNAKWVLGYRGTNELMLALERGEIDMTSTGNLFQIQRLIDSGKFRILVQTGTLKEGALVPRPDFGNAPIFASLMAGRLADPIAAEAFDYWGSIVSMDKWLALPPRAPPATLDMYRQAYARLVQDPDFLERGRKISDDFVPMASRDVETLIRRLGRLPQPALDYMTGLLRRQGLEVQ
jgi:hypothetical protein